MCGLIMCAFLLEELIQKKNLFTCLAASFSASLQVAAQVMEQILEFMKLLMPAYYMAVAFSGGSRLKTEPEAGDTLATFPVMS